MDALLLAAAVLLCVSCLAKAGLRLRRVSVWRCKS